MTLKPLLDVRQGVGNGISMGRIGYIAESEEFGVHEGYGTRPARVPMDCISCDIVSLH